MISQAKDQFKRVSPNHISSESREAKEQRRFKAATLFQNGVYQAEVARQLGVTPAAVHGWYHTWKKQGRRGLRSKGHPGFSSQLTDADRKKVKRAILQGARKFGYDTDLWTLERIGAVMRRVTGKSFGHTWIWQIILSLGFMNQKPERRSQERDEKAIREWKELTSPRFKKWAQKHAYLLGFQDESGISERPFVSRTWALKGRTPFIPSTGSWKNLNISGIITNTPLGNHPQLFLRIFPGSMKAKDILRFLKELKAYLKGRKLLLIWDGLPAHRAKIIWEYTSRERQWLRIERFPAYAPELNPIEYLWSSMKRKDIANQVPRGLGHLQRVIPVDKNIFTE